LSLGIIENHGGTIRVDSQSGVGATVIIEWPVQASNIVDSES